MKKGWLFLVLFSWVASAFAFNGLVKVDYVDGTAKSHIDMYFKGDSVYIKQTAGGVAKYDYYIVNLATREFCTVSKADKKTVIKYDLDKLLAYYESSQLTSGYVRKYDIPYKLVEKVVDGKKTSVWQGDKPGIKISLTLQESIAPVNDLIPLLRLLNCWNEADGNFKNTIVYSESETKGGTKKTVNVTITNESYTSKSFSVPANYTMKDFTTVMEEKKNTEELKTIIQAFAGF